MRNLIVLISEYLLLCVALFSSANDGLILTTTPRYNRAIFLGKGFDKFSETAIVHHGRVYGKISYLKPVGYLGMRDCQLEIVEPEVKEGVLANLSRSYPVNAVNFSTMLDIVTTCQKLQSGSVTASNDFKEDDSSSSSNSTQTRKRWKDMGLYAMLHGIFPGTKWCGVNDIADNYFDLGSDSEVDKCCRSHDHCPIKIMSFSENYGVYNYHPYTKSHCDCDDLFYDCLKRTRAVKADALGNIFFNVMGMQCAEPTYSKQICDEENSNIKPRGRSSRNQKRSLFGVFSSSKSGDIADAPCRPWSSPATSPTLAFRKPRREF